MLADLGCGEGEGAGEGLGCSRCNTSSRCSLTWVAVRVRVRVRDGVRAALAAHVKEVAVLADRCRLVSQRRGRVHANKEELDEPEEQPGAVRPPHPDVADREPVDCPHQAVGHLRRRERRVDGRGIASREDKAHRA